MKKFAGINAALIVAALFIGCGGDPQVEDPGPNPFLDDFMSDGKEDSGYVNLRGVEVEVTIEADLEATSWRMFDGPAELAQFALTYLRKRDEVYLEILAEDADTPERVEWLVNGEWLSRAEAEAAGVETLRRFRIQDVNVVLLNGEARRVSEGQVFEAEVPVRPYDVMTEAQDSCADYNSHLDLSQSVYWYLWNPSKSGCELETQQMTLTVEDIMPSNPESYPEYDQLIEDGRLDVVVLFGKADDGAVEDDYNWQNVTALSDWLLDADFEEVADPPLGRRFVRTVDELVETVDIYGPDLFHSVADRTRFHNWQRAVSEHEVVMYNGHSVLGSGMAFEEVDYPDFYQIFQVASCLSYEYYVRPVLAGKGGWENVDVISNVEPTYYGEGLPLTSTILARLFWGAENGGQASWQDIMEAVSQRLYHFRFGVSGARGNCFSPEGNRCEEPPPPPEQERFESTTPSEIPDNDPQGVTNEITVEEGSVIGAVAVEIDATHTWVGDLQITVSHGELSETVWARQGGSADNVQGTFELSDQWVGVDPNGSWSMTVSDHASRDTGTLNSWALLVTPAQ